MFYCVPQVLPPAVYMRVTENVSLIVAFIERIIGNGHAYVTSQGVYLFSNLLFIQMGELNINIYVMLI